ARRTPASGSCARCPTPRAGCASTSTPGCCARTARPSTACTPRAGRPWASPGTAPAATWPATACCPRWGSPSSPPNTWPGPAMADATDRPDAAVRREVLAFLREEARFAQLYTVDRQGFPVGRTVGAPINDDWSVDLVQRRVHRRLGQLARNPHLEI